MKLIFIILGVISLFTILILWWMLNKPAVSKEYYKKIETYGTMERRYTGLGSYDVSNIKYKVDDKGIGFYQIYYPAEMIYSDNKYPLVIMVNGTGIPAKKYKAIFHHLSSWGFIVIGNEDKASGDGKTSCETLNYILSLNDHNTSIFYRKININHIGIGGYSQGGIGTINAVTVQNNGNLYSSMFIASTPHLKLSVDSLKVFYDIGKVNIPIFMVAATGTTDSGNKKTSGITPLWSINDNFNTIKANVLKVKARRNNAEHKNMISYSDGYMTAWFLYTLLDDKEAGKVFIMENSEILSNTMNWTDVEISLKK